MSQVHGTKYEQREIVLVPFPYSDLSITKKRPVLIISNNHYNSKFEDIVVCVITSKIFQDEYSILLKNENLEFGILPEDSCIKVHKLFSIHQTKIIKKFSRLDEETFQIVTAKINELIRNKM
ncbi:MAG: transcriptional modulator of MazE/toxin, MazF [Ignavibacteria bacterium]|nr:transcriptional modulator of MazE/toxin, MazF [Ignavibacteria bacterium]